MFVLNMFHQIRGLGPRYQNGQSFTVCSAGNPTYLTQIVGWTSKACFLWVLTLRFRSRFCLFQAQICERMWVKDGPSFLLFVSIYIHDFHAKMVYPYVLYTRRYIYIYIYIHRYSCSRKYIYTFTLYFDRFIHIIYKYIWCFLPALLAASAAG